MSEMHPQMQTEFLRGDHTVFMILLQTERWRELQNQKSPDSILAL